MKPALKIRKVVNGSLLLKMRDWKHQWMPILELQLKSLQKSWVPVSDQFLNIWTKLLSLRCWRDGYHTIWIKTQNTRHYEVCSAPHLRKKKKKTYFSFAHVIQNGSYMATDNVLDNRWIERKLLKSFQSRNSTKIKLWWLFGETDEKHCQENDQNASEMFEYVMSTSQERKGPNFLHDHARPHVAGLMLQKLNELGYETLPHPPYSPVLLPIDYHLFKHLDFL